jgi:hypothetical protein
LSPPAWSGGVHPGAGLIDKSLTPSRKARQEK